MSRMKKGEEGHEEAVSKWHESMLARFGSEEGISEHFKSAGAKGGHLGHEKGFYRNRELARTAGAKGGALSKRGPSKKTLELLEKNKTTIIDMVSRDCTYKEISEVTGIPVTTLYNVMKRGLIYV